MDFKNALNHLNVLPRETVPEELAPYVEPKGEYPEYLIEEALA